MPPSTPVPAMKTIFDVEARDELIERIGALSNESRPLWGKMTICQMATHMNIWNEWVLGRGKYAYKQEFMGKLLGRMMLKSHTKDDTPMSRGMPAGRGFTVKEKEGDLELLKRSWIGLIAAYADHSNPDFIHDFYGRMTRVQIGVLSYKHADHHLRQFGT
jgi:hypothetical protein